MTAAPAAEVRPLASADLRRGARRYGSRQARPALRAGDRGCRRRSARQFGVFAETVAAGNVVRGINATGAAGYTRKQLDELTGVARQFGAKGLAWLALEAGEGGALTARSPIAKFFSAEEIAALAARFEAGAGDLLLFVADTAAVAATVLGRLRSQLGPQLYGVDDNELGLRLGRRLPAASSGMPKAIAGTPSTTPSPRRCRRTPHLLDSDPGAARAAAYDMVLNGYEVGGGSIRIHDRAMQERVFGLLGYTKEAGLGPLRPPAARLRVRRPAARRYRPRHRPHRDDPGRGRRTSAR